MRKTKLSLAMLTGALCVTMAQLAYADPNFDVSPWTYVGKAGDCGTGYAAGSKIIVAKWIDQIGLQDESGDADKGLLLSKNGPTSDCSAAGASIKNVGPVKRGGVTVPGITLTQLGYDVRNGGHCASGAPRFDVNATDGWHFMGACNNATVTALQAGWNRVRIDPYSASNAFPPLGAGATIISIDIVFDEGVDAGPDNSGLAIIDNIDINGTLVGK